MTIRYQCPECDAVLKIKDELAGTSGKCPKCKSEFVVPEASSAKSGKAEKGKKENTGKDPGSAKAADKKSDKKSEEEAAHSLLNQIDAPEKTTTLVEMEPGDQRSIAYFENLKSKEQAEADQKRQARLDKQQAKKERKAASAAAKEKKAATVNTIASAAEALHRTAEEKRRRAGMPDEPDDEGSELVEAVKFLGRQYAPWIGGGLVLIAGLYYMMDSGLGDRKLPELIGVYGVITIDGQPVDGAIIRFSPVRTAELKKREEATKIKHGSSTARTNAEGEYEMQYLRDVFGAVPGRHMVTIESGGKDPVPLRYSMGEIEVTVSEEKDEHNFKLRNDSGN